MKIIFMRHGEATDNVKELISDKIEYNSVLTENGIKTAKESVEGLNGNIDIMYVSPFPRTQQTASYVSEKYPDVPKITEDRIGEIFYGDYSHKKNDDVTDRIRRRQVEGEYFLRFGGYGECRYDIEHRLTEFLCDVFDKNEIDSTVLIVSHGTITSYMKRILKVPKTEHIMPGKVEEFDNVTPEHLYEHRELLKNIYEKEQDDNNRFKSKIKKL